MAYNYGQYVANLANMLVIQPTDPNYQIVLPSIIDDAEQRVYRELDLLTTIVRDQSGFLTPNSRNFTFPQHFVVSESINVFTPSGSLTNRNALTPVSIEWMDSIWGNEAAPSSPSIPQYYAMVTDQMIIVGPPPDAPYSVEVVGTIRPTPLSSTNQTTYLTLYLPDLFFAASLVFGYGFMKDYGATTDDPNAPGSWEAHYQKLASSANVEEFRKKYGSQGWSPKQPDPIATPPRA